MITWVFWESHVTELCEKWICCRNDYVYTRFEEFRICSGEVLFTNEHKAVFLKNKAKTYIDINGLEIFKYFSKKNKTKFKRKPRTEIETITTETIKIISAKKDKNIKGNHMSKIEKYTYMISDIYDSMQNTGEKLTDKAIKLQNLILELDYQNNLLLKSKILEEIDAVLNDGLNIVWNMVSKQNRNNKKITINKQKDISGHLRELLKIVNEKKALLTLIAQKMESLITTIKNKIDVFNEKLYKANKINKAELQSIESILTKFLNWIIKNFKEIIV